MKRADFLVEIGTEELPPKALRSLELAFRAGLAQALDEDRLAHGELGSFSSPRRLAVIVADLAERQEDRRSTQKGPPVKIAFDADGKPGPAALAFADKCGVAVEALGRESTPKGEWLTCDVVEEGAAAAKLLPGIVERALAALPVPRRMRWGAGDAEFVRPVHWIVMLHGTRVVDAELFGIASGRDTFGHRFHSNGPIAIGAPGDYVEALEKQGHVIADFERRRALIEDGVAHEAGEAGGRVVDGERLYDEVAALVEWPVPLTGRFDESFLDLPREAVISTLTGHQRYFAIEDEEGALLPRFVTVANIDSTEPARVRDGNERVVRPRLADAKFFWDTDRQRSLDSRRQSLARVVYQQGLGSVADKSVRTASIAKAIAAALGHPGNDVERAALLAKCDLVTGMVGEFPELQGTMGRYYAEADGEPGSVAAAIGEQYLPRFAGDSLPASADGRILAVADRLDTLAGIFTLGKKPSGNRDPFGLRRAALGIVRILVECELDIDLGAIIRVAVDAQPAGKAKPAAVADDVAAFISDRLRRYFLDGDASLASATFDAVLARAPASLVDFAKRLVAVQKFIELDAAESLAAANKRIANILKKAEEEAGADVDPALFAEDAERELQAALEETGEQVAPLVAARDYTQALAALAALRGPVDRFFDDVMVMADDAALRRNRLALLAAIRGLFLDVADISRLDIG